MTMLVVGLTGGIASGKSLVGAEFAAQGIPVIDADILAREVVAPGSEGLKAIVAAFGEAYLRTDGTLDRRALRAHVFAHPAARRELESILHPQIREKMDAQLEIYRQAGEDVVITAIPLLVETGQHRHCDRVLVVDAADETRIHRLSQRDGITAEEAHSILSQQASREERLRVANDIIVNEDHPDPAAAIRPRVAELCSKYRSLAQANAR